METSPTKMCSEGSSRRAEGGKRNKKATDGLTSADDGEPPQSYNALDTEGVEAHPVSSNACITLPLLRKRKVEDLFPPSEEEVPLGVFRTWLSSNKCANPSCTVSHTESWNRGWPVGKMDYANLCNACWQQYINGTLKPSPISSTGNSKLIKAERLFRNSSRPLSQEETPQVIDHPNASKQAGSGITRASNDLKMRSLNKSVVVSGNQCANPKCGVSQTCTWRKGWPSATGNVRLCNACGKKYSKGKLLHEPLGDNSATPAAPAPAGSGDPAHIPAAPISDHNNSSSNKNKKKNNTLTDAIEGESVLGQTCNTSSEPQLAPVPLFQSRSSLRPNTCANASCGKTQSCRWQKGWLVPGERANLCRGCEREYKQKQEASPLASVEHGQPPSSTERKAQVGISMEVADEHNVSAKSASVVAKDETAPPKTDINLKQCMNPACGATSTCKWLRGWPVGTGFVRLCSACGQRYRKGSLKAPSSSMAVASRVQFDPSSPAVQTLAVVPGCATTTLHETYAPTPLSLDKAQWETPLFVSTRSLTPNRCANKSCGTTRSFRWQRGWRIGHRYANLCGGCGKKFSQGRLSTDIPGSRIRRDLMGALQSTGVTESTEPGNMTIPSPESGVTQDDQQTSVPALQTELGLQTSQMALAACVWLCATASLAKEMQLQKHISNEEPHLQENKVELEGTSVQAFGLIGEASRNSHPVGSRNPCLPARVSGGVDRRRNCQIMHQMGCSVPTQSANGRQRLANASLRVACRDVGTQTPSSPSSNEMKETHIRSDLTGSSDFSLRCCWMAGWFAGYLQHTPQAPQE